MRICHFSDLHADRPLLPKADLYVATGDMFPNFSPSRLEIDPEFERIHQTRWIKQVLGSYRNYMPRETRDNPVICVKGNHDFVGLSEAFGGNVWEVDLDPTRTTIVHGLKVGGCRGIPFIVGEWSDEFMEIGKLPEGQVVRPPAGSLDEIVDLLPKDLDVLLTHAPPNGVLDSEGAHYGSRAILRYINIRMYGGAPLKAHFFGHVHGSRGSRNIGGTLFSNAARSHQVYELA